MDARGTGGGEAPLTVVVAMGLKPGATSAEPLRPRLRELDLDTGAIVRDVALPVDAGHADEHAECTAGRVVGDVLWQCTRSEVFTLDWPALTVRSRFSHPLLYDVHDVLPLADGGFAVSCAGHESVLRFDADGALVRHWWLRGPLEGFAEVYGGTDFSRVPYDRFKPHSHHPNHVFVRGEALWATVFEAQVATELGGGGRISFPEAPPHDGRHAEGLLWFTTVDGHVIAVNPQTLAREAVFDVGGLCGPGIAGWCRGVEVVGDRLFVGMSTLRKGRHRELLRRLVRGGAGVKQPTRVLEVDRVSGALVRAVPVGNEAGGTIYAIYAT